MRQAKPVSWQLLPAARASLSPLFFGFVFKGARLRESSGAFVLFCDGDSEFFVSQPCVGLCSLGAKYASVEASLVKTLSDPRRLLVFSRSSACDALSFFPKSPFALHIDLCLPLANNCCLLFSSLLNTQPLALVRVALFSARRLPFSPEFSVLPHPLCARVGLSGNSFSGIFFRRLFARSAPPVPVSVYPSREFFASLFSLFVFQRGMQGAVEKRVLGKAERASLAGEPGQSLWESLSSSSPSSSLKKKTPPHGSLLGAPEFECQETPSARVFPDDIPSSALCASPALKAAVEAAQKTVASTARAIAEASLCSEHSHSPSSSKTCLRCRWLKTYRTARSCRGLQQLLEILSPQTQWLCFCTLPVSECCLRGRVRKPRLFSKSEGLGAAFRTDLPPTWAEGRWASSRAL